MTFLFSVRFMNYRHYQTSIVPKMLIVHIFLEYGFCTFWAFCETKGAKSAKDRFIQLLEYELCTFSAFCSCKVCKMRKVQIPHIIGDMMNLNVMAFVDFVDFVAVDQISPQIRCSGHTECCVCCLYAECQLKRKKHIHSSAL